MDAPLLQLKEISRSDGDATLLSGVDLHLDAGEVAAVLGPTGSGKTTLLRLIMGLDAPDRGEILSAGQHLAAPGKILMPPHARGFSMVFQESLLLPFLDVEDNVLLGVPHPGESTRRRFERVVELCGLEALRRRRVTTLSGGEQQRVALARALMVRPRLLLLDEPFQHLDVPFRERLFPEFRRHLEVEGIAALIVTHDRREAFYFGQRLFILKAGELRQVGAPAALYRRPRGAWEAELLGESNVLSAEAVGELLEIHPATAADADVLIRPEHLDLSSEPPHNGTVVQIDFLGSTQSLLFRPEHGPLVRVCALTHRSFEVGRSYRLTLRHPDLAVPLEDPAATPPAVLN